MIKPNDIKLIREVAGIDGILRDQELCEHMRDKNVKPDFKAHYEQFHWSVMTFNSLNDACAMGSTILGKPCFINALFEKHREYELIYLEGNETKHFCYID